MTHANAAAGAHARASSSIVRALDLGLDLGDAWPKFEEPIYFVAQGLSRSWPELDRSDAWIDPHDVSPVRWGPGENIWVVSTYLKLRRAGLDVRIVDRPVQDAVNVCYLDAAIRTPGSHRAFVVVAQADRCYLNWGEYTIAQSPAIADRTRTCLIDVWPQPGLIGRDERRGTGIARVGYTGNPGNLADVFRTDDFRRDLERIGVEFAIRSDPSQWHDFHDLDLHLAVRDGADAWIRTKPATKLVHSWLAGCPGLLGPEPSFQYWGEDGSDYVEVRRPADVIAAIGRLRQDPELYRRMQARGTEKAAGRDEEGVCRQWAAVLAGPVRHEFERWRHGSFGGGVARRLRRGWQGLAAPVSRKLFFARGRGWKATLQRVVQKG